MCVYYQNNDLLFAFCSDKPLIRCFCFDYCNYFRFVDSICHRPLHLLGAPAAFHCVSAICFRSHFTRSSARRRKFRTTAFGQCEIKCLTSKFSHFFIFSRAVWPKISIVDSEIVRFNIGGIEINRWRIPVMQLIY